MPLIAAFYFVADRRNLTVEAVRRLPFSEFYSWISFYGFYQVLDRRKS